MGATLTLEGVLGLNFIHPGELALPSPQLNFCKPSIVKSAPIKNTANLEELKDEELVEIALCGDCKGFQQLVTRYQTKAHSLAYGILKNFQDAEDVAQEAFTKAYKNLAGFKGQSGFYTWFYRIVFNLSIDVSRKKYRKVETTTDEEKTLESFANANNSALGQLALNSNAFTPEEIHAHRELRSKINYALSELSDEHRAVVILREVDGLSYEEISDIVGCNKGTVMSRLHHARKKLQKFLADDYVVYSEVMSK